MNTQVSKSKAQDYYEINGYYLFRNLVPHDWIETILDLYRQEILPSKWPFLRQNTGQYERNIINEYGYMARPLLDIHGYQKYAKFSQKALEIFCSDKIQSALREITGFHPYNLMQTMLFDANTATPAHQDCWYTDSVPNGQLVGTWIALEDIDEKAGRFYVLPKSMDVDFLSLYGNLPHSQWIEEMKRYVNERKSEIVAPALKKGDVLFWNSRTIHGALQTLDQSFSRKSLTAHYLPSGYMYGSLFTTKEFVESRYQVFNGMKYYVNQPDYSLLTQAKCKIRQVFYNSPKMMKVLRQIQRLLK